MAATITISIPGERFDLDVTVCTERGLSPIEWLVLEAVINGDSSFESLTRLFGLGRRLMLDLISDLWRRNYLFIDVNRSIVEVPEDKQRLIEQGDSAELPSGRQQTHPVSLVHDLFAGHVVPILPYRKTLKSDITAPNLINFGKYREISMARMSSAIDYALKNRPDEKTIIVGSTLRNVVAHAQAAQINRWFIQIEANVEKTPDGSFQVAVVHPKAIDGRIRRSWEKLLVRVAEERSDLRSRLNDKIQRSGQLRPLRLREAIHKLETEIGEAAISEANATRLHSRWRYDSDFIVSVLEEHGSHAADVSFIMDASVMADCVIDIIENANHQLVISSPWQPDHDRLLQFERAIAAALERNVRVIVLRDVQSDRTLEPRVTRAFNELEKKGAFYWPRQDRPFRTNERFVVGDMQQVLVSNSGCLDRAASHGHQFAALVQATDGKPLALAADVLQRVHRNLVDQRITHLFQRSPGAAADYRSDTDDDVEEWRTMPFAPPERKREGSEIDDNDAGFVSAALTCWHDSWKKFIESLQLKLNSLSDLALPVFDNEHQVRLDALLQPGSSRFVLVCSEIASFRVLSPAMEQRIRDCVAGGMRIAFVLKKMPTDEATANRLRKLKEEFEGLSIIEAPITGGMAASEKELIFTSVPWLAVDTTENRGEGYRRRLEFGVRFFGRDIASRGLAELINSMPEIYDWSQSIETGAEGIESSKTAQSRGETDSPEIMQELFTRLHASSGFGSESIPRILANWFRERASHLETYWNELAQIVELVAPELRHVVIASAISAPKAVRASADRQYWLGRLVADRWAAGCDVEASLLLKCENLEITSHDVPPESVVDSILSRVEGSEAFAIHLLDLQERDLPAAEVDGLLCIAAVALLDNGIEEAEHLIRKLVGQGSEILLLWLNPVLNYWAETGESIPHRLLEHNESAADTEEIEKMRFEELRRDYSRAGAMNFKFNLGQETWAHLFDRDGEYGQLTRMLDDKDVDGVRLCVERWRSEDGKPEQLMDAASDAVWKGDDDPNADRYIALGKRRTCLKRLYALVNAAESWLVAHANLLSAKDGFQLEQTRVLGLALAKAGPDIEALLDEWEQTSDFRAPLLRRWVQRADTLRSMQ